MIQIGHQLGRRQAAGLTAVVLAAGMLALPTEASATPPGAAQERPPAGEPPGEPAPSDSQVLVAADNTSAIAGQLGELQATIAEHVEKLDAAEKAMTDSLGALADADASVNETNFRIEDLIVRSDEVVVEAFVNPPQQSALEVLATADVGDATVRHGLLDLQARASADILADLAAARADLEEQQAAQEEAHKDAEAARAEAEAALADLDGAMGQQGQFALALTRGLDAESVEAARVAASNPALAAQLAARRDQLSAKLDEMRAAEEYAEALARLAEARRREAARRAAEQEAAAAQGSSGGSATLTSGGGIVCPVAGPVHFTDTWGAARSGGRVHKGVDMMAAMGTPTVAPVSGRVEHRVSSLGGLSWYVYGDNGNMYYGTHLSGYANQGVGWVAAGTVIGYVGESGNAPTPHLHFEFHPGGGEAVNPYPLAAAACPNH
jgi:peptidoglycan LD-endopeptidase LytH